MYSTVDDTFCATYTIITWIANVINVVGFNRNVNVYSLTNNNSTYSSAGLLAQGEIILIQILSWLDSPSGPRPSHCWGFWSHSFRHTTLGRTPLDKRSARRKNRHLTTHKNLKRQTYMSPARFEPAIKATALSLGSSTVIMMMMMMIIIIISSSLSYAIRGVT
jgi:hypothetical protein